MQLRLFRVPRLICLKNRRLFLLSNGFTIMFHRLPFRLLIPASRYNLYIVLRHTDAYNYNNIWLRLGSKAPGDTIHFQNINLSLATDANGWEGTGTDDIFEVRKNITPGPVPFKKPGEYTFSISQIMRENPLKHILNVGLRIEKVK